METARINMRVEILRRIVLAGYPSDESNFICSGQHSSSGIVVAMQ